MSDDLNNSGGGTEMVGQKIDTLAASVGQRFDALSASVGQQFVTVNEEFATLSASVDERFTTLSASVDGRFTTLSASVDERFSTLSASVDERFDAVDVALVEQRQYTEFTFNRLDSRFDRLERKLDQFIDTQSATNRLVERRLTALEPRSAPRIVDAAVRRRPCP